MTSQYRHRRTSNPATVFPNPIEPGEITVNTANRQIAVGDAASGTLGAPKPLLPIRYFDIAAQYVVNDFVVNGTALYRANKLTGPGPFVAADWVMMVGSIDPQYVAKAGDTMTGMLTLPATAPSTGNHATNKTYVDNLVALKSSVIVSNAKPTPDPINSTLWYNTLDGQLYIRFNDGNSTQWVIAAPQPDASNYTSMIGTAIAASTVRYDTAQTLTEAQRVQARQNIYAAPFDAMSYSGMQINGSMEVSQENGATAKIATTRTYIVDGWMISSVGTQTMTGQQQAGGPSPNFSNVLTAYASVANAAPAAGHIAWVNHCIEGYRVLRLGWGAGGCSPITLGFWVFSTKAGLLSGSIRNSANDRCYVFTYTINAASTWEYKTITIPGDTTGVWLKGAGTGIDLSFAYMVGTTFQTTPNTWTAGNFIGAPGSLNMCAVANTDYLQITGVVVLPGIEAPSAARSPLIMRPYDQELVTCQRYWYSPVISTLGYGTAGNPIGGGFIHPQTMRASPTATRSGGSFSNSNTPVLDQVTASGFRFTATVVATGHAYVDLMTALFDARL